MSQKEKDHLADAVREAKTSFESALSDRRRFPKVEFQALFEAVRVYVQATESDTLIRRDVASAVYGLRGFLEVARKRVPGEVLRDADRMECLLFGGWDPLFEGFEPPPVRLPSVRKERA